MSILDIFKSRIFKKPYNPSKFEHADLFSQNTPQGGETKQFGQNDVRKFDSNKRRWTDADEKPKEIKPLINKVDEPIQENLFDKKANILRDTETEKALVERIKKNPDNYKIVGLVDSEYNQNIRVINGKIITDKRENREKDWRKSTESNRNVRWNLVIADKGNKGEFLTVSRDGGLRLLQPDIWEKMKNSKMRNDEKTFDMFALLPEEAQIQNVYELARSEQNKPTPPRSNIPIAFDNTLVDKEYPYKDILTSNFASFEDRNNKGYTSSGYSIKMPILRGSIANNVWLLNDEIGKRLSGKEITKENINKTVDELEKEKFLEKFYNKKSINETNSESDATSKRTNPKNTIWFKKPLVGLNGKKLIGYGWAYKNMDVMSSNRDEGLVSRNVSDWDNAVDSDDTGRKITHQFYIEDGKNNVVAVSSESIPMALGFSTKDVYSTKDISSLSKSIGKGKMSLETLKQELEDYNQKYNEIKEKAPTDIKIVSYEEALKKTVDTPEKIKRIYLTEGGNYFELDGVYDSNANGKRRMENLKHKWVSSKLQSLGIKWNPEFNAIERKEGNLIEKEKQLQELIENESGKQNLVTEEGGGKGKATEKTYEGESIHQEGNNKELISRESVLRYKIDGNTVTDSNMSIKKFGDLQNLYLSEKPIADDYYLAVVKINHNGKQAYYEVATVKEDDLEGTTQERVDNTIKGIINQITDTKTPRHIKLLDIALAKRLNVYSPELMAIRENHLANIEAKHKAEDEKRANLRKKEEEERKAKDNAVKEKFKGFLDNKEPMRRGKIIAELEKPVNIIDDRGEKLRFTTKLDAVEYLLLKGGVPEKKEEFKYEFNRRKYNSMNHYEQVAYEKKLEEKETVYRIGGYKIGKTAYDYAQHLVNKKEKKAGNGDVTKSLSFSILKSFRPSQYHDKLFSPDGQANKPQISREGQTKQGKTGTLELRKNKSGKGSHWNLVDKKQNTKEPETTGTEETNNKEAGSSIDIPRTIKLITQNPFTQAQIINKKGEMHYTGTVIGAQPYGNDHFEILFRHEDGIKSIPVGKRNYKGTIENNTLYIPNKTGETIIINLDKAQTPMGTGELTTTQNDEELPFEQEMQETVADVAKRKQAEADAFAQNEIRQAYNEKPEYDLDIDEIATKMGLEYKTAVRNSEDISYEYLQSYGSDSGLIPSINTDIKLNKWEDHKKLWDYFKSKGYEVTTSSGITTNQIKIKKGNSETWRVIKYFNSDSYRAKEILGVDVDEMASKINIAYSKYNNVQGFAEPLKQLKENTIKLLTKYYGISAEKNQTSLDKDNLPNKSNKPAWRHAKTTSSTVSEVSGETVSKALTRELKSSLKSIAQPLLAMMVNFSGASPNSADTLSNIDDIFSSIVKPQKDMINKLGANVNKNKETVNTNIKKSRNIFKRIFLSGYYE